VKILLVEDDKSLAEMLKEALTTQHYLVDLATDGQEGWDLAEAFEYDLILLDWMLPKLDGLSFCKQLRSEGNRTPILLLTAQSSSIQKVKGLDAGADDYVVKPFDLHELFARIRALLRRESSSATPIFEWGSLRLDPGNCEVSYDTHSLRLTAKEYSLLELFMRNPQRIFSQSALLDHLWSFDEPPTENAVRAHIKSLRQKLKKAGAAADVIETVYGLGYRLKSRDLEVPKSAPTASPVQEAATTNAPQQDGQGEIAPATHLPSVESQTQPQIPLELAAIWEQFKDKYSDRVTVLEQAVTSVLKGNFTEELRQQALREAHTLAGSLGSFGLSEASHLSREIEQLFHTEDKLSPVQKETLSKLVVTLRQALCTSPATFESGSMMSAQSLPHPLTANQNPRLLIVDDDVALATVLVSEASARGIQAEVATSLSQARDGIAQARPDVVLLDLCFPDSIENGFGLLAELTSSQPPIPVVVFTAEENFTDRVKVARMGGRGFLQKPVSPVDVINAIVQVLQHSSTPEAKLLIVDDDPQLLDFLRTLLEPWAFRLTLLDDPKQFWTTLEQSAPDLLILDIEMPELSGIDLCRVVRNDPRWSELPVLFLSAYIDAQTVHRVFSVGADDYVSKPVVGPELVARVLNRLERTKIRQKLRTLSS
jgi:DNA-binding response OmpR family regulator